MPSPESKPSQLSSSEQLDLWEHASFLYHNYEWQDAADAFRFLGDAMRDTSQRMFCHLNGALILARLGDFEDALECAEVALYLGEQFAIPSFLLGLIEAELGHTVEALEHFERCANQMGNSDVDYSAQRLYYMLRASTVQDNASKMWSALQIRSEPKGPPMLSFIPADVLFEAPMRAETDKRTVSWESKLLKDSRLPPNPRQAVEAEASRRSKSSRMKWLANITASGSRLSPGVRSSTANQNDEVKSEPADSEPMVQGPLESPRARPRPRDAQATYESTRELARFIRHAGPSTNNEKVTIDQEYMLCLLQQDSSTTSQLKLNNSPRLQSGAIRMPLFKRSDSDEYGSVLDYYTTTARRIHSMSAMAEKYTLRESQLLADNGIGLADLDGRGDPSPPINQIEYEALRPPPLFHSRNMPAVALPETAAEDISAQRRFPDLGTAKHWLKNELLAPRTPQSLYRRSSSRQSSPTSSVQTRARSTVSSTEIFRFGMRSKKPR